MLQLPRSRLPKAETRNKIENNLIGSNACLAVWPDLANFRHFGKILKIFRPFWRVYLALGKIINQIWLLFNAIEHIFILENSQKLNK